MKIKNDVPTTDVILEVIDRFLYYKKHLSYCTNDEWTANYIREHWDNAETTKDVL